MAVLLADLLKWELKREQGAIAVVESSRNRGAAFS
jgi:hypothetical protein